MFRLPAQLVIAATLALNAGNARAATWQDLWQRPDQQAAAAMEQAEFERAATLATDPLQRGNAYYRDGDHSGALQAYDGATGSLADYNRGNALARLGRLQDAIAAYDRALQQAPDMEDARFNRELVQRLLSEQQPPPGQNQQSGNDGERSEGQQNSAGNDSDGGEPDGSDQSDTASPDAGANDAGQQQAGTGSDQSDPAGGNRRSGSADHRDSAASTPPAPEPAQQQAAAEPSPGETDRDESSHRSGTSGSEGPDEASTAQPSQPHTEPGADTVADRTDDAAGPAHDRPVEQETPEQAEQRQAMAQWLRRIPDDPGGLLRRKFLYQYRARAPQTATPSARPW